MSTRLWIVCGCLVLAALFGGCDPGFAKVSPDSGTITIYANMEEHLFDIYLAEFHKQYPEIKVNHVRKSTGALTEQLLAEQDDPKADLVWAMSATVLSVLEWNGVLEPYTPAGLERVQPQFRDTSNPPNWVGMGAYMSVFCVNPERIASLGLPMPEGWTALTDPIYRGQIVMPNPTTSSTAYTIVEGVLESQGEVKGWEYLDALDKNIYLYTEGSNDACEMVSTGDVAIGLANDQLAVEVQAGGAPITVVFPAEGSSWDMEANALIKKDEISPAALTFLDWAISDAAMRVYAKDRAILSVGLADFQVPPGFPAEPVKQLMDKDFPWASANRAHILAEWLSRYGDHAGIAPP